MNGYKMGNEQEKKENEPEKKDIKDSAIVDRSTNITDGPAVPNHYYDSAHEDNSTHFHITVNVALDEDDQEKVEEAVEAVQPYQAPQEHYEPKPDHPKPEPVHPKPEPKLKPKIKIVDQEKEASEDPYGKLEYKLNYNPVFEYIAPAAVGLGAYTIYESPELSAAAYITTAMGAYTMYELRHELDKPRDIFKKEVLSLYEKTLAELVEE
jgi:hypothetical protein